jgi:septal ring factor EnvC (AmiA/AmiB activator)
VTRIKRTDGRTESRYVSEDGMVVRSRKLVREHLLGLASPVACLLTTIHGKPDPDASKKKTRAEKRFARKKQKLAESRETVQGLKTEIAESRKDCQKLRLALARQ